MTTPPPQEPGSPQHPEGPYDPYYRYRQAPVEGASAGQPWDPAYPYPYAAPPAFTPPTTAPQRRRRGAWVAAGVTAVAAVTAVGVALATGGAQTVNGTALSVQPGSSSSSGSSGSGSTTTPGTFPGSIPGGGSSGSSGSSGGSSSSSGSSSSAAAGGTATAAQQVGVVDIVSVQGYSREAAAGTGMVLTSNGQILTNNHVIDGATSIRVTVVATGKTYTAKVVGTSPTNDIAMLQLQNASGLQTAKLGDSGSVKVGDAVTGVGNAGGKGGTPSAAAGKITRLNKTITASDEGGTNAETLSGVIVTDAPIQAGDSGGPLYNSSGDIIGIDTAASTRGPSIGFAIPINKALSIIAEIKKGIETTSIHIGYPGFLGITIAQSPTGAVVNQVVQNGPADNAGLEPGDVITKVGGTTVASATALQKAVSAHDPGSKVSVTYVDQTTGTHTVTVTLATGPAD